RRRCVHAGARRRGCRGGRPGGGGCPALPGLCELRRLRGLRGARGPLPRARGGARGKLPRRSPAPRRSAPPLRDSPLLPAPLCLLAFGAVMVFSASSARSLLNSGGNGFYYLERTLVFGAIGLLVMRIASVRGVAAAKVLTPLLLACSLFLLFAVLMPG